MVSANGLDQRQPAAPLEVEPRSDLGIDHGSDPGLSGGYTIQEACDALGIHPNTIRRRSRKGKLLATRAEGPGGQEYRISLTALEELRLELTQAERAMGRRGVTTGQTTPANGIDHGLTG